MLTKFSSRVNLSIDSEKAPNLHSLSFFKVEHHSWGIDNFINSGNLKFKREGTIDVASIVQDDFFVKVIWENWSDEIGIIEIKDGNILLKITDVITDNQILLNSHNKRLFPNVNVFQNISVLTSKLEISKKHFEFKKYCSELSGSLEKPVQFIFSDQTSKLDNIFNIFAFAKEKKVEYVILINEQFYSSDFDEIKNSLTRLKKKFASQSFKHPILSDRLSITYQDNEDVLNEKFEIVDCVNQFGIVIISSDIFPYLYLFKNDQQLKFEECLNYFGVLIIK